MDCKQILLEIFWEFIEYIDDYRTIISFEQTCNDFSVAINSIRGETARRLYERVISNFENKNFVSSLPISPKYSIKLKPQEETLFSILKLFSNAPFFIQKTNEWYSLLLTRISFRKSFMNNEGINFLRANSLTLSFGPFSSEPNHFHLQFASFLLQFETPFLYSVILNEISSIINHRNYVHNMFDKLPSRWNKNNNHNHNNNNNNNNHNHNNNINTNDNNNNDLIQNLNFIENNIQFLSFNENKVIMDSDGAVSATLRMKIDFHEIPSFLTQSFYYNHRSMSKSGEFCAQQNYSLNSLREIVEVEFAPLFAQKLTYNFSSDEFIDIFKSLLYPWSKYSYGHFAVDNTPWYGEEMADQSENDFLFAPDFDIL